MKNEEKKMAKDLLDIDLGKLYRAKMDGREIEARSFGGWVFWCDDNFNPDVVYRVKPEFRTTTVDSGRETFKYVEIAALKLAVDALTRITRESDYGLERHIADIAIKRLEGLV